MIVKQKGKHGLLLEKRLIAVGNHSQNGASNDDGKSYADNGGDNGTDGSAGLTDL